MQQQIFCLILIHVIFQGTTSLSELICSLFDEIIEIQKIKEHNLKVTVMDIACGYHSYMLDIRKKYEQKVSTYLAN